MVTRPTKPRAPRRRRSSGRTRPASPAATDELVTTPARCAVSSFSIFIASTMQITAPSSTSSPSATRTSMHRALHRADDRVRAAAARRGQALLAAAGELAVARLGAQHGHLDAAAVQLDRECAPRDVARPAPPRRRPVRRAPPRARASSSDSTTPWQVSPRDEARMLEQRAVEADERLHAADLELLERAQHAPPRALAVGVAHDQLRDHRVVEVADLRARDHARVDAHARARRLAVRRDAARRRAEAGRHVLRVDAALDRVAAQHDVLLAQRQRLARRDAQLLAHEVDAGHQLGDGVLDLDARVHLHEVVGAVRREQPLDRPGQR